MPRPDSPARFALVALFAGACCISMAPIFVRLSELGPVATAFYRILLALPVLLAWSAWQPAGAAGTRVPTRRDRAVLLLSGLFFAGDLALWHWSIRLTTVANATLFANFAPIFVTAGAVVLFGQRVSRLFLVSLVLAVAGVAMLAGANAGLGGRFLLGDALGIATAVFYAAYILTVARLRASFSTATVMAWSGVAAAPVLLAIALITGEALLPATAAGWLVLAGLALISHTGGQGMIAFALAHLPTAFSSVGLLLQPVLAALIAWALFGEAVTGLRAAGAAVVLAGIYFAHRGSPRVPVNGSASPS